MGTLVMGPAAAKAMAGRGAWTANGGAEQLPIWVVKNREQ